MTNIAMENPQNKWRFLAGKIIYFYGQFSMAMLKNQRVNPKPVALATYYPSGKLTNNYWKDPPFLSSVNPL